MRSVRRITLFTFLLSVFFLFSSSKSFSQAHFQSIASGSWGTAPSWQITAGSDGDGIPDANDTVEIRSGYTITVGATPGDCAVLLVDVGGTLSIAGAGSVRVNGTTGSASIFGTVAMSSSGSLAKQGSGTRSLTLGSTGKITLSGNAASPTFDTYSFDPASTFEYTASGNQNVLSGVTFGNLTLGGSGTKLVTPVPADTLFRFRGKLTVSSGVTFDVSTSILHINFDGDVENSGTIDASVGITVLTMEGAHWVNNGTFLASRTPGFGYTPISTFTNCQLSGSPVAQVFYNLVMDGTSSTLTNLQVDSNFTIASGAVFNAGTGLSHQVKGDWTNGGTFNAATSTVTFNGTSAQEIGATTFHNLTLNNSAGTTLTGNVMTDASGTFTLTSGTLNTGSSTLAIASSAPGALQLGTNRILGTVSRTIAPGSTSTYLFTQADVYAIPGGTGNPSAMTVTVHPNTNPPNLGVGADTNKVVKRFYTLSASGAGGGFYYALRLAYDQSEVRGNEAQYVLWQNAGSFWAVMGTSDPPDTLDNWVQQTTLGGFGDFAIAETQSGLPVELVSFTGEYSPASKEVHLSWSTASEVNNYGFFLQRRQWGDAFFIDLTGSFVGGGGSSLSRRTYSWIDHAPPPGTLEYRLKQVDLDGTAHFSWGVRVTSGAAPGGNQVAMPAEFALRQNFPNPFNPSTQIQFTVEEVTDALLAVYNLLGEEVTVLYRGAAVPGRLYTVAFDGTQLTNGIYIYRLRSGGKTSSRKMVLVK